MGEALKSARAVPLWRAIEAIIPDARDRAVLALIGSPLTHARFLRRPYGTYGAAIEDVLKDGSTPIPNLVLAGDGIFPGIGIPAVALSGASAANGLVGCPAMDVHGRIEIEGRNRLGSANYLFWFVCI